MLSPWQLAVLAVAGVLAGAVNGVAGGGSLISFPTLLAMGYPPVTANVTSAVTTLPGYVGGLAGYRQEMVAVAPHTRRLAAVSVAGAAVGSMILLIAPAEQFTSVVPVLVLASVIALAAQPMVARRLSRAGTEVGGRGLLLAHFVVSVYGGYFAAGLGVMMLAILGTFVSEDLHRLNALKSALSLIVGAVSALCFAVFGPVQWTPALVMSLAGIAGGRGGVTLARHLPPHHLRRLIVGVGLVLSTALFLR
ncbi:sulfite exporter TauE/SafE family protein [Actinomadura sp. NPDC048955]|uniref:sulfite exporter TauE/SafE family protein n=1 Tax=Actinomadura sp. NPDC048955 TaxID=3158228 RepID=UPI0033C5E83E